MTELNGKLIPPGDQITSPVLNCVICVDSYINGKIKAHQIQPAFTIAPFVQMFPVGPGQTGAGVVPIPVCLDHRKEQLGIKGGLIIA